MHEADSRTTRASLLLRLRDPADSGSWGEFARVYAPVIRAYCRRRGLQTADADDLTQDVLAQVARSIGDFDYQPVRGRFRDWLGAVTRHKIARFLEVSGRPGAATAAIDLAVDGQVSWGVDPEWSAEFHARVLEVALARVRSAFEPATWEVFLKVWSDDRPAPEVAREAGMSIDAVYAAKSRVLSRLREEVLELAEDLPCISPSP